MICYALSFDNAEVQIPTSLVEYNMKYCMHNTF